MRIGRKKRKKRSLVYVKGRDEHSRMTQPPEAGWMLCLPNPMVGNSKGCDRKDEKRGTQERDKAWLYSDPGYARRDIHVMR